MTGSEVFAGLPRDGLGGRHYCEGWTAGHDDASQELPWDSTLVMERSWYAEGYRDGYEDARRWKGSCAAQTMVGLGTG